MNIHYTKRTPLSSPSSSSSSAAPNPTSGQVPYPATYHGNSTDQKALQSILPLADVVVFCLPGSPETKHLLNSQTIQLLPLQGSRIVNVGRGSVIDEKALLEDGLKAGKVISCGLDVYEKEPVVEHGLLGREDVVLLPHVGSSTIEVYEYSALRALDQIETVLGKGNAENKVPEFVVN